MMADEENVELRHAVRMKDAHCPRGRLTTHIPTTGVGEDNSHNLGGATRGVPILVVLVDNNHPFDVEAYLSGYTSTAIPKYRRPKADKRAGRTAVDCLVYIINIRPPLAVPAPQLAARHIVKARDVDLYRNTASAYDVFAANAQLPPTTEVAPLDQAWYKE